MLKFQSTPPSLAETTKQDQARIVLDISIHSAIASGDGDLKARITGSVISIHSAIASGDFMEFLFFCLSARFQSTPPSLAETVGWVPEGTVPTFQSTPPSLAETPVLAEWVIIGAISIHSAIASGDNKKGYLLPDDKISIHSAIASGDQQQNLR